MATFTEPSNNSPAFSVGPKKIQFLDFSINSGETSASVTATNLSKLEHIVMGESSVQHSAAPTFSGNVATLAIVVPAETAASLIVQDITYTAVANLGASGNSITIAYTGGGTAGSEVVSVVGNAISIQIESTVSTATQVKAAFDASAAAIALASAAISGTAGNAQSTASATPLAGGVTGGARGKLMLIGR